MIALVFKSIREMLLYKPRRVDTAEYGTIISRLLDPRVKKTPGHLECPECGSKAVFSVASAYGWYMQCGSCGKAGFTFTARYQAEEQWWVEDEPKKHSGPLKIK
jgi:ribosomal protein L37AE/L43A